MDGWRKPWQLPCGVRVACGLHGSGAGSAWRGRVRGCALGRVDRRPGCRRAALCGCGSGIPMLFTGWPVQVWCLTSTSTLCHSAWALPLCWVHTLLICMHDPSWGVNANICTPWLVSADHVPRIGLLCVGVTSWPPPHLRGRLVASLGRVFSDGHSVEGVFVGRVHPGEKEDSGAGQGRSLTSLARRLTQVPLLYAC